MLILDRIWITWETQRRSVELSKKLNCLFYNLDKEGILRYPYCLINTVIVFLIKKPKFLFVQNPSMILAFVACLFGIVSDTKIIVDRHTTFRLNKPHTGSLKIWLFMKLHYFTLKYADMTIVTNDYLSEIVENSGGNPCVLPDILPAIEFHEKMILKGTIKILLISSFGLDEPINEVISAVNNINNNDISLYITGNYKKFDPDYPKKVNSNIHFTGFVSDTEYQSLLHSVDIAIVLTTSDYCMLCGCYEAVAVEIPLITSDKSVLRNYFTNACFVDNSIEGIEKGINDVCNNYSDYKQGSVVMKKEINCKWNNHYLTLLNNIHQL